MINELMYTIYLAIREIPVYSQNKTVSNLVLPVH